MLVLLIGEGSFADKWWYKRDGEYSRMAKRSTSCYHAILSSLSTFAAWRLSWRRSILLCCKHIECVCTSRVNHILIYFALLLKPSDASNIFGHSNHQDVVAGWSNTSHKEKPERKGKAMIVLKTGITPFGCGTNEKTVISWEQTCYGHPFCEYASASSRLHLSEGTIRVVYQYDRAQVEQRGLVV